MTNLSLAAQAVMAAYGKSLTTEPYITSGRIETAVAAALYAAADQLDHPTSAHTLYAIAEELDSQ